MHPQPTPPWLLTGDNAFAHVQALHTRTLHPYERSATAIDVQAGLSINGDTNLNNHALLNASINATLIDGGVLETARIPELNAGKITAGVLDALRIPALAAGKIATGVLDLLRIPRISPAKGDMPTGAVQAFAGPSAPPGWLLCNGVLVRITDYAALFGVLAHAYALEPDTTDSTATFFRLPDLRGRTAIGAGQGTGLTARALGTKGGAEHSEEHLHKIISNNPVFYSAPTSTRPIAAQLDYGDGDRHAYKLADAGANRTANVGASSSAGIGNSGNMPPWTAVNYIIKT